MSLSDPPVRSVLVPGYTLDRYELLCPIAEGGMAAVWLAHQHGKHGFRKLVAIKTILPKYASEEGFHEMFLDEARVAARVEHANVAQVLDLGEDGEVLYLVMEWVDGDSLLKLEKAAARKDVDLPHQILLRVLSDACGGLHAAHVLCDEDDGKPLAVVHRDVSPQNLLVSTQGITKVIDFGIAKAKKRAMRETTAGVVKGKLNYMAPEQSLGMAVDCRADIWAIGAIFYRIITGKPPYDAANPRETTRLVRTGKLSDPLTPQSGVHPAVIKVIETSLRPDPAHRYSTAAEMHDALEWAMRETGLIASTKDVSTFMSMHLADRASSRKQAVQLALDAAATREKLNGVLKQRSPSSNSLIITAEHTSAVYTQRSEHMRALDASTIRPPRDEVTEPDTARAKYAWLKGPIPRKSLAPLAGIGLVALLAAPLAIRLSTEEDVSVPHSASASARSHAPEATLSPVATGRTATTLPTTVDPPRTDAAAVARPDDLDTTVASVPPSAAPAVVARPTKARSASGATANRPTAATRPASAQKPPENEDGI